MYKVRGEEVDAQVPWWYVVREGVCRGLLSVGVGDQSKTKEQDDERSKLTHIIETRICIKYAPPFQALEVCPFSSHIQTPLRHGGDETKRKAPWIWEVKGGKNRQEKRRLYLA
jgi:hypothetical protein